MIRSFADQATEDIFDGINSRNARRICPRDLWRVAARKLDLLDAAEVLDDLKSPPGNRLEALSADRRGQYSIRINQKNRICFEWVEDGPGNVKIVDYHR